MRNWLALLLIPICLLTIGDNDNPSLKSTTATTEEIILVTTEPTIEATTEVTVDGNSDTSEWLQPDETAKNDIVEEEDTETSTDVQESGLVSLGTFSLTAYCSCRKCCGQYALNRPIDENGNEIVYGSIGVRLEPGVSIAVDPRVIPYGTQVVINGHTYTAHDTGGDINGNRIDVYFDDHQEALIFGAQKAEVFVYG